MPRKKRDDGEAFGSDSFLDIVANMVGILIILVIIAGLRAKQSHAGQAVDTTAIACEVEALAGQTRNLQGDVLNLANEIEALEETDSLRHFERDTLALAVAARQHELNERREKLDGSSREQYDLRRSLAAVEEALDGTTKELARSLAVVPVSVNKIETYPTPLSRTVVGQEIHFQLKGGRATFIPMDELVQLFQDDVREKIDRLRDKPELIETVGPLGGFAMTYTLQRIDVAMPGGSTVSRLAYGFTLQPESEELGETQEEALRSNSQFRAVLGKYRASSTTLTLWTYPDSFAIYRALKKDLYLQGFAVAGRPMPAHQPIGGSPGGSKSAAE